MKVISQIPDKRVIAQVAKLVAQRESLSVNMIPYMINMYNIFILHEIRRKANIIYILVMILRNVNFND